MKEWIILLNTAVVSLFGSILSASFCDALNTRNKRRFFCFCMLIIPVFQICAYSIWEVVTLRYIYPLIVHLPLLLVLFIMTGKLLWPLISILTAYLCCELRCWIALLVVELLRGGDMMQDIAEIIVTLPLLFLLLRFFTPVVRQLSTQAREYQWQFALIPAVYYCFDYGTRVYTDLLYSGIPAADEPGHGIGIWSICTIVENYGGMYDFLVQNGQFILRLSF